MLPKGMDKSLVACPCPSCDGEKVTAYKLLGFVTLVSQSDALGYVTHLRLSLMRWAL